MNYEELKREILSKKSWLVLELLSFIRDEIGVNAKNEFLKEFRQYTDDPTDSFYLSSVLVMFIDNIEFKG